MDQPLITMAVNSNIVPVIGEDEMLNDRVCSP